MNPRPITDPITLRLDRWASILRNTDTGTFDDEELMELSTLLTAAANEMRSSCDALAAYAEQAVERLRELDPVQVDMLNDSSAPAYAYRNGAIYRQRIGELEAEVDRLRRTHG